jgi:hypothetical protein
MTVNPSVCLRVNDHPNQRTRGINDLDVDDLIVVRRAREAVGHQRQGKFIRIRPSTPINRIPCRETIDGVISIAAIDAVSPSTASDGMSKLSSPLLRGWCHCHHRVLMECQGD